ncbi:MAG: BrnT family toxin [Deltaproteobacteria bacterium]|nr:BrnT family toxin [Deltaproteobacteria bacterium]
MQFEWDPNKEKVNRRKHGIAFKEAVSVFKHPLSITTYDPDHSKEEDRFITFGFSAAGQLLMVAHTDRGDRIRIISARILTRAEREAYEEEIQRRKS